MTLKNDLCSCLISFESQADLAKQYVSEKRTLKSMIDLSNMGEHNELKGTIFC